MSTEGCSARPSPALTLQRESLPLLSSDKLLLAALRITVPSLRHGVPAAVTQRCGALCLQRGAASHYLPAAGSIQGIGASEGFLSPGVESFLHLHFSSLLNEHFIGLLEKKHPILSLEQKFQSEC